MDVISAFLIDSLILRTFFLAFPFDAHSFLSFAKVFNNYLAFGLVTLSADLYYHQIRQVLT